METIVLFFFQARLDLPNLKPTVLLAYTVAALVFPAVLVLIAFFLVKAFIFTARLILSWLALFVFFVAVEKYSKPVIAESISEQHGDLVVRLPLGADNGLTSEQRIQAANSATGEILGVLSPLDIGRTACLCIVFDRMNVDFWDDLDNRKRRNFSPPSGVKFAREIPDRFLVFLKLVQCVWRT
jgi:hypothetical protein